MQHAWPSLSVTLSLCSQRFWTGAPPQRQIFFVLADVRPRHVLCLAVPADVWASSVLSVLGSQQLFCGVPIPWMLSFMLTFGQSGGFSAVAPLLWNWLLGSLDFGCGPLGDVVPRLSVNRDPFRGFRYGEALHPGPGSPEDTAANVRVAIVNPTAIHKKEDLLDDLGVHVLGLSETSAVSQVQQQFSKNMWYKTFCGAPVPPHGRDEESATSLRGLAGGVAICTKLPARSSPSSFSVAMSQTTRLVESMIRFGCLEVRCIAVYGVPQSHADARDLNNALLTTAWERTVGNKHCGAVHYHGGAPP